MRCFGGESTWSIACVEVCGRHGEWTWLRASTEWRRAGVVSGAVAASSSQEAPRARICLGRTLRSSF